MRLLGTALLMLLGFTFTVSFSYSQVATYLSSHV